MLDAYKKSVNSVFDNVKKQNHELSQPNIVELKKTEQPHNQTSKQATKQTIEQATKHLSEQLPKQVPEQQTNQASKQTTEQPNNKTSNRTTEQTHNQTSNRTTEQAHNQTSNQPPNLNTKQFDILRYIYFNRPFKVKGENGIEGILNIKYGNVRNSLASLTNKGYIEKPFIVYNSCFNGSTCRVNEDLCFALFGITNIEQPHNRTSTQASTQANNRTTGHTTEQSHNRVTEQTTTQPHNPYISSSSFIKLTTTGISAYEKEPELSYWRDCNLTTGKIDEWLNEYGVSEFQMLQSLRFAQFDLINNDKEKTLTQKNPISWFEGALRNLKGVYSKPSNYKSQIELDIEEEEKQLSEQKRQLKILKEKREENLIVKAELWFFNLDENKQKELIANVKGLTPQQKRNFESTSTRIAIKKLYIEKA